MVKVKKFIIHQKQVVFFVLVGGISALAELLFMKLFIHIIPSFFSQEPDFMGIKYPLSNIFSTTFAILFNYWLSIKFVFQRGKYGVRKEFAYFMVISTITTFLSLFLFQIFFNYLFHDVIDFRFYTLSPVMLSKFMAIGFVSVINYFVKKKMIFKS